MTDIQAIDQVVRHWALCRDTRQWEGLRRCYAPGASVKTTWMVGSAEDFIAASIRGADNPQAPQSLHSIGASSIEVLGDKALAETRMVLMLRAPLDGVEVDITAWGRFLDFLCATMAAGAFSSATPSTKKTGWTRWTQVPC